MKIAVIGGTGLIGSQVAEILNAGGHEAVPHSPSTGVDLLSGQGLPEALNGADVVVNLTNSPTFDEASATFFQTSLDNLLAAARAIRVYRAALRTIAERLDVLSALRPGLTVDRASDILWFYFGLHSWRQLNKDTGWTFDDAQEWLQERAAEALLSRDAQRATARAAPGSRGR
jgi:hypothetical protein